MPLINFHGTADRAAPYNGGYSWMVEKRFPDVRRWTASWAQRNDCAPDPVDSTVAADVMRRTYVHCADNAAVVLYTIIGGGHTWPGSISIPSLGMTTQQINASNTIWAFFAAHPLQSH